MVLGTPNNLKQSYMTQSILSLFQVQPVVWILHQILHSVRKEIGRLRSKKWKTKGVWFGEIWHWISAKLRPNDNYIDWLNLAWRTMRRRIQRNKWTHCLLIHQLQLAASCGNSPAIDRVNRVFAIMLHNQTLWKYNWITLSLFITWNSYPTILSII